MSAGALLMRVATVTHQGRIRTNNEDCLGVCEWVRSVPMTSALLLECLTDEPRLCVVADGLGGQVGGETASLMAVQALVAAAPTLEGPEGVIALLKDVNRRLYDAMDARPELRSMGATAVGLVATGAQGWLFNVGDSRGYVASGGRLRLLSTDDTIAFNLTDASERTGQFRHTITQALGGLYTREEVHPHVVERDLAAGDRYLLCSDGLTDMLDAAGIEKCLVADTRASVENLLAAALAEGGHDNVSVILIDFLAAPVTGS